jgi:hypothetical protein
MNSGEVVSALRVHFPKDAYALLEQVGNGTGYNVSRHADALVMSLWPSRGLDITGIEVKVSRADWKRELDKPDKAEPIAKYCDFWAIAAPQGLIDPLTLPEPWGLLEACPKADGFVIKVVKRAERLEPKAIDRAFLAGILRQAQTPETALQTIRNEERERATEAAKEAVDYLSDVKTRALQSDLSTLKERVADFETATGIPLENHTPNFYGYPSGAALGRALVYLVKHGTDDMCRAMGRVEGDARRVMQEAASIQEALATIPVPR